MNDYAVGMGTGAEVGAKLWWFDGSSKILSFS